MTNWRQYITDLDQSKEPVPNLKMGLRWHPPISAEQVSELQNAKLKLPSPLFELLQESNGITNQLEIDGEMLDFTSLIWSLEDIVRIHLLRHTDKQWADHYGPLDGRVYFTDVSIDGISFAIVPDKESEEKLPVYIWYPATKRFKFAADSLEAFLGLLVPGKLTV